jgi:hypothetical protein
MWCSLRLRGRERPQKGCKNRDFLFVKAGEIEKLSAFLGAECAAAAQEMAQRGPLKPLEQAALFDADEDAVGADLDGVGF